MYTPWSLRTRKIWLHNDVVLTYITRNVLRDIARDPVQPLETAPVSSERTQVQAGVVGPVGASVTHDEIAAVGLVGNEA